MIILSAVNSSQQQPAQQNHQQMQQPHLQQQQQQTCYMVTQPQQMVQQQSPPSPPTSSAGPAISSNNQTSQTLPSFPTNLNQTLSYTSAVTPRRPNTSVTIISSNTSNSATMAAASQVKFILIDDILVTWSHYISSLLFGFRVCEYWSSFCCLASEN